MPDYMVPMATGYPVPRVDFSPIGNLPEDYFKGTQNRRTLALQDAFKNGLPTITDPVTGEQRPDFEKMTQTLVKLGGPEAAQQAMQMWLQQSAYTGLAKTMAGSQGMPQGGGQPEPRPHTIDTGPADIMRGQQPKLSSRGTDNAGADTIRSLATELSGGQDANGLIRAAAMQFRVGPDQELSPEQAQVIKDRLTQLRTGGGGPPAAANDLPGPSPSGMVAGPGVPPQQGGQPAAQPGPVAPTAPQMAQAPQAAPGPVAPPQPGQGGNVLAVPPEFSKATRDRLQEGIRRLGLSALAPGITPADKDMAKQQIQILSERIKAIDEFNAERGKIPPEIKTSIGAGFGTDVPAYEGAKAQSTKLGGRFADQYSAIQGAAAGAAQLMDHTRLFRSILNSPNFYSGPGENLNLQYKKWVSVLGGDNTAVPQEAFRKIMAQNILEQVNQMKTEAAASGVPATRLFQSQIELMNKAAQNPSNTVEANRMLTEIAHRNATRLSELAEMADRYAQAHNNRLDQGFNRMRREYERQHSLFTPEEINNPSLLTAPRFDNAAQVQGARLDKRKTPVIWISPTPKHPGGYYNTP